MSRLLQSDLAQLKGIPASAVPLWRRLLAEDLVPVYQLINEVSLYRQTIEQASSSRSDRILAKDLARVAIQLLSTIRDETPPADRRLIQAAVRYFVLEDDADGDLDSVLGFDDDAAVMNAVLRYLGHSDWIVDAP